jgi:hypothetical protein
MEMTRDYKAEVLQILTDAKSWIRIDAIHDAIRNASPLYQPWGHVSRALGELSADGVAEYRQQYYGEMWRLKR